MLKKLAIVAIVLLVVAGFVLFRDWDSPELGQTVMAQASAATGAEVSASGFRLNLLRGLVMEGVKAEYAEGGREVSFSLDRLVFEHRLGPLLRGTVAIDRILLERPQIELLEPAAATEAPASKPEPAAAEPVEVATGGLALHVREVAVRDASLVLRQEGVEGAVRIDGLDFEMENLKLDPSLGTLAALSATGGVTIREIDLETLVMTATRGGFELADGRFKMPDVRASLPHGDLVGDFELDLNPVPFTYRTSARCDAFDLDGLVGGQEGFGPASAEFEAHGAGPETADLEADGRFRLAAGVFPDAPLFAGIDAALGKQAVVGAPYEATEIAFTLRDDVFRLAPFRFEGGNARLGLEGSSRLEGPIDFAMTVSTPREGVAVTGTGGDVLDLLTDDEGWLAVPMSLTGTYEEPKVRPDTQALMAQAKRGAGRAVQNKAEEKLRGLFGKKKD